MLILVANGPRMYREALGIVLRQWRPMDRVLLAEPADLHAAVTHLEPQVIVCDPRVHRTDRKRVWIELDGAETAPEDHARSLDRRASRLPEVLATIELTSAENGGER